MCNSCLFIFPLRGGAMVWAAFIAVYSALSGIFMLKYGYFLYFGAYEYEIYGGLAFGVAGVAAVNVIALGQYSLVFSRACNILWPIFIILCGIRDIFMITRLDENKWKVQYECDHGGYLYGANPANYPPGKVPHFGTSICKYGVPTLYCAMIFGTLIDLGCQSYMAFLNWCWVSRLGKYNVVARADLEEGYA